MMLDGAPLEGWRLTEEDREAIRTRVRAELQELKDGLAPFFLGRFCPAINAECKGPECQAFVIKQHMDGQKLVIEGGNCVAPVLASQVTQALGFLTQLTMAGQRGTDPNLGKVITNGPVIR